MLIRSLANDLIPQQLRSLISSAFSYLFTSLSSTTLTLIIDENCGMTRNEVYEAADTYLRTKINLSMDRLRVSKTPRQKGLSLSIEKGQEIDDLYEDVKVTWKYVCTEGEKHRNEKRHYELSFRKICKDKVVGSYLPYVLDRAQKIKEEEKVLKLYSRDCPNSYDDNYNSRGWGSIILEHPSTFETLAMDPEEKQKLINDLERFVKRKEFYKRAGKAWKRGYLLYGPPGTGKSSLIAAMANYLKFDVYDLELTSIYSNSDLRWVLLSTRNRSILVIEDLDCTAEMQSRQNSSESSDGKLTLSGMLNFIDGLWSSCGDERIIVFTTNHKDKLDPALLRPGRMDVHINMSYCSPCGFDVLATNYLGDQGKDLDRYREAKDLIGITNVTPAEVAEELMKSDDADVALQGLVNFLKRKKDSEVKNEPQDEPLGEDKEDQGKRIKTEDND